MSFAETLFEIARTDLDAAKYLFERELYPQAVFYLQQSVEKANKSFAILNGVIEDDEKDLKNLGHDSMEVYRRTLNEQKEKLEIIKGAFEKIHELKDIIFLKDLDVEKYYEVAVDSLAAIKGLSKDRERILFISERYIISVIKDLDQLESQNLDLKNMKFSSKDLNETKESLFELFDVLARIYPINPLRIKKMKEEVEEDFTLNLMDEVRGVLQSFPIKEALYVSKSLYYFSLMTLPHAINTRYPSNNHNPLKFYNLNLPLIQLFNDVMEIMEKTLSKLGILLTDSNYKGS